MDARRLTVLQVLPALNGGGVERGVLEVGEALVKAGHRSLVVSAGGRMVAELRNGGSEHIQLPVASKSPLSFRSLPHLRNLMLRERVDVVDLHSRLPGWLTWLAWKSLPARERPYLVSTLHGLHSVNAYSSIMCRGETVIAVSETVRTYIRQNFFGVDDSRIRVIPRGVDAVEFPRGYYPKESWLQQFYDEHPQLVNQRIVTLAGRVTRLKGHLDLLHMIKMLKARNVSAHGLIVGESHPAKTGYHEELQQVVADLGLTDDVTFTGHRSDLKEIYSISQLVVQLSRKPESFGRSAAEALSMGVPVLGYDHGGVSEILATQFPQGLVPVGDVESLAGRAEDLLSANVCPFVGTNAFSKQKMLDQTLDVYQTMESTRRLRHTA